MAGVVIYTDGRNGQDRALAVTLEQLATTLPCISFDSLAGFNGVGARGAGESRSYAEDERNRDSVLPECPKPGQRDGVVLGDRGGVGEVPPEGQREAPGTSVWDCGRIALVACARVEHIAPH
eukprot:COSAG06_NODE_14291_length_1169_cov_10.551402_2_plen_122_part_00